MEKPLVERPINFAIFKGLNLPELSIKAGQTIIAEGAKGETMYLVRQGVVDVVVNDTVIEQIGAGGIFGEMALIDHAERSAKIVANTDAFVVPLDEKKFIALVAKVPHFSLLVMRTLARRIRNLNLRVGN